MAMLKPTRWALPQYAGRGEPGVSGTGQPRVPGDGKRRPDGPCPNRRRSPIDRRRPSRARRIVVGVDVLLAGQSKVQLVPSLMSANLHMLPGEITPLQWQLL